MLQLDRESLARARRIDPRTLDADDRVNWEMFVRECRVGIEGAAFPEELIPINQVFALPTDFAVLGSGAGLHPFDTIRNYDDFLSRAHDFSLWVEQAITNMRAGIARGVVQPRVIMEKALPQLSELIVEDPTASVFYKPVEQMPSSFTPAERARLEAAYRKSISAEITPAYRRLRDFIQNEYLPQARATVAWTSLPNGAAWYRFRVATYTTTDLTPDEIHRMGLDEVAHLRAEMEKVRTRVGFAGTLGQFFEYVKADPQFYYNDGRELLQGFRDLKKNIDARLPKLFARMPKHDYEVREIEQFRAAASPGAFYQPGTPDGSRPAVFYVNTYNLRAQPKFGMETLSLHEAAPGHHFQIAIQKEMVHLPRFRRYGNDISLYRRYEGSYTAYVEGWALYCETLGRELGLFTDPYQYYGHLSDQMLRAMRLVVDTGLHTQGWSREQAIQYMLDNSSMAASDVEAEVERYIADPGQALSYKIGQLKIRELRTRAERTLGPRFDIRRFHARVLESGPVPLTTLQGIVDRWIAAERARP
jgi:uncharacterized protein (DUF885 family)